VKKIYNLAYGRDPNEQEVQMALDYLHTEPMKEYEENKNKAKEQQDGGGRGGRKPAPGAADPAKGDTPAAAGVISETAKPAPEPVAVADAAPAAAADANAGMGMGLMGGMGGFMGGGGGGGFGGGGGRGRGGARPVEVKYEATAWGRYAKILLSSTEFTFIN